MGLSMRAQRIPRIKLRQDRNATFDLAYPRTSGLRAKTGSSSNVAFGPKRTLSNIARRGIWHL
jgi:hypothetical protein